MARLYDPFNARLVDPTLTIGGGLPLGENVVVVSESSIKDTKAGDGNKFAEFILKTKNGEQGIMRLNLYNSKPDVREIAERELSRLCHAVGLMDVGDTSELHNIPFMVIVGKQKNSEVYTEVKKILRQDGSDPADSFQPNASPAQGQATNWGNQAAPKPDPVDEAYQEAARPANNQVGAGENWAPQPDSQPANQGQPNWGSGTGAAR